MIRFAWVVSMLAIPLAGCATARHTDTSRTAVEQLLISNAVDQALQQVDFQPLNGQSVFVNDKFLDGVDKNYVIGTIRHRTLGSGARLVEKIEDADVVLEVRSGGIGTDRMDSFVGSPNLSLPGPFPLHIPEVRLLTNKTQSGTAKLAIIAYDANTRQAIGSGGTALARAEDNHWFFLGMGPFHRGHVREEVARATGDSGGPLELARYLPLPKADDSVPVSVSLVPPDDGAEENEPPPGAEPPMPLDITLGQPAPPPWYLPADGQPLPERR